MTLSRRKSKSRQIGTTQVPAVAITQSLRVEVGLIACGVQIATVDDPQCGHLKIGCVLSDTCLHLWFVHFRLWVFCCDAAVASLLKLPASAPDEKEVATTIIATARKQLTAFNALFIFHSWVGNDLEANRRSLTGFGRSVMAFRFLGIEKQHPT